MSGGAGHLLEMIQRLRNNDRLRKHARYFDINEAFNDSHHRTKATYKTATPEELEKIRKRAIAQRKKEARKTAIVVAISIPIALLIFFLITWVIKSVYLT